MSTVVCRKYFAQIKKCVKKLSIFVGSLIEVVHKICLKCLRMHDRRMFGCFLHYWNSLLIEQHFTKDYTDGVFVST